MKYLYLQPPEPRPNDENYKGLSVTLLSSTSLLDISHVYKLWKKELEHVSCVQLLMLAHFPHRDVRSTVIINYTRLYRLLYQVHIVAIISNSSLRVSVTCIVLIALMLFWHQLF